MAPPPEALLGGNGTKRKFGEDLDNAVFGTKQCAPLSCSEQVPRSVTTSEGWVALQEGRKFIHKRLTGPFRRVRKGKSAARSVAALMKEIDDLLDDKSAPIIIGVSGGMGAGKSATLNSMFHCGGQIARSGKGGGSCTMACHQFMAPKKGQQEPFNAEVFFFKPEEQSDILLSYLQDYYRLLNPNDDDEDKAVTPEDRDMLRNISEEISTTFVALFGNDNSFRTKASVRQFLERADSEDDPTIVGPLVDMCTS